MASISLNLAGRRMQEFIRTAGLGQAHFFFFFFGFVLFILFLFSPLWGPGQGFSRVFFQSLEQASKLLLFETLG